MILLWQFHLNGLHSNGYSMVRNILNRNKININKKFFKKRINKTNKNLCERNIKFIKKKSYSWMCSYNWWWFARKFNKNYSKNICANIYLDKIKVKPIFKWIKSKGVSDTEMLKTFNCGIGFCIITKKKNINKIKKIF